MFRSTIGEVVGWSLLWLAVCSAKVQAMENASVDCWRVAELDFTTVQEYPNPYRDVSLTARFEGPGGRTITRPGFWFDGNRWKIRFAPTAVGTWTWRTACSNAHDPGLHGRTGTIDCRPYGGDLPVYRRGFIRISGDRRHFVYADGTPFFWLGDTHWMMADTEQIDRCNHPDHAGRPCPHGGQFQHIVADRLAKRFTVYQTYPNVSAQHWWAEKYDRIDVGRFNREFDFEIDYLAARGFVIAMGLGHLTAPNHVPETDLKRWARYIVARYGAYPVVWITGQEINAPQVDVEIWKRVAAEIDRADGYSHPHSGHQWVIDSKTRPLGNEPWHDWFALQGGHGGNKPQPKSFYKDYWDFTPIKPVLETEANYELVQCGGKADQDGVRFQAYKAIGCGSCGYTYGGAGIWACRWSRDDTRWLDYNREAWFDGLDLPGSRQMKLLRKFYEGLPWWKLVPRWDDPAWAAWENPEQSVLSSDGNSTYVVYFYAAGTATGTLKSMDAKVAYTARWFDPRTGKYRLASDSIKPMNGDWAVPEKPDAKDWLLVVNKK